MINKDSFENFINKKHANLPISKELQQTNESDLLVSSEYNRLYPSAMAHKDSKWPVKETAVAKKTKNSTRLCELFNSGEWKNLNKARFIKVNY